MRRGSGPHQVHPGLRVSVGVVVAVAAHLHTHSLLHTNIHRYGAGGFPAWGIMPNSVLLFEIEVLSV